jgi:hypothetical protein
MTMKTNLSLFPAAAAVLAGLIALPIAGPAQAQPRIDPATGMPVSGAPGAPGAPHFDPATGMVAPPGAGAPQPGSAGILTAQNTATVVQGQIDGGQYDEALQSCLAFYNQLKGNQSLVPLLDEWVELGRRYPKAREALVKIRDHCVHEFSAGRGYAVLFAEVKAINASWNEEDATVVLFQSIREKDRRLAGQCYPEVEDLLMQRGEYLLCLECLGDPQAHFKSLRGDFQRQVALQERMAQIQRNIQQHQEEMANNSNFPPPPAFSRAFPPPNVAVMATNNFVKQVVTLEQILAGVGRQADAEQIRDQALALVADDHFRTALTDPEPKLHQ